MSVDPISNEATSSIPENVFKLRSASYGTMQSMYRQYGYFYDYMWFNGEPWFSIWYGESMGQDEYNYFIARQTGNNFNNWTHMSSNNTWGGGIAWTYPYAIVSQANYMITGEKACEERGELEGEFAFRFAQAHTMRAHAYIRLHQMFGPRWVDSNNGQVNSVVLREDATNTTEPSALPLSTTKEVLDFIYEDLDRAIELYELSEMPREFMWETDVTVAYGLYARAALLKDDWENAEKYAHLASESYQIMSAEEYESGFNAPTSEWMWCSDEGPSGIYYASFGASFACNGAYPCLWGSYGAGQINYTLFKQMYNAKDVRSNLFFTPDKVGRGMRPAFWKSDDVSPSTMNANIGDNLPSLIQRFATERYEITGKNAGWIFPYSGDYFENLKEIGSTYVGFGSQFKFWGKDNYSSGQFPFMRASEMVLIEAEAACHNGNYTVAQDCLERINKNRIDGYTRTNKTGDDLLEEVKLNRRWELWGEGFSWFDFKRWNEPIVRDKWVENDQASGNWPSAVSRTFDVSYRNNWVWPIPRKEIDFNDDVNESFE
ncbi:MAG: RagB/SusD family nutrient uptake outer membrane protein [Muribaculaceae bacterium]|nr:RagB/SusD family nutrient uptake outer membrane protein [Muribaculaceae bacterium]